MKQNEIIKMFNDQSPKSGNVKKQMYYYFPSPNAEKILYRVFVQRQLEVAKSPTW